MPLQIDIENHFGGFGKGNGTKLAPKSTKYLNQLRNAIFRKIVLSMLWELDF